MTFDEAKLWSTMSPYPVLFDRGAFWVGHLMTKKMAMCLSGLVFFKIGMSPSQKNLLWEDSVNQYREFDSEHSLGFNIFDYNAESHFKYLSHKIWTTIKDLPLTYTKEQFIKDFLINQ